MLFYLFYVCSGRVYDEVVSDSNKITRMPPNFIRASSLSLNRSLSIRSTSSRRAVQAPATNRYSMGAILHSDCEFDSDLVPCLLFVCSVCWFVRILII